MAQLGLPHPRSRVVNRSRRSSRPARELEYPIIVKPNIGGSGALMRRFDSPGRAAAGADAGELDADLRPRHDGDRPGVPPARGGSIVRVEALDDRLLYAHPDPQRPEPGFNLCPADICQVADGRRGQRDDFDFCPADAPARRQLQIEAPTAALGRRAVVRIFARLAWTSAASSTWRASATASSTLRRQLALELRDRRRRLVGFDPFARFVDFLDVPGW